jgi:hypothetical protein
MRTIGAYLDTESKPKSDVHRGVISEGEATSPLSAPGVVAALYESACKLGPLTRCERACVTYGNIYE